LQTFGVQMGEDKQVVLVRGHGFRSPALSVPGQ
jgi:hypothetical protein